MIWRYDRPTERLFLGGLIQIAVMLPFSRTNTCWHPLICMCECLCPYWWLHSWSNIEFGLDLFLQFWKITFQPNYQTKMRYDKKFIKQKKSSSLGRRKEKPSHDTVDGRNPKQPPGMYKNRVNDGTNYLSLNWLARFLNHQPYVRYDMLAFGISVEHFTKIHAAFEGSTTQLDGGAVPR